MHLLPNTAPLVAERSPEALRYGWAAGPSCSQQLPGPVVRDGGSWSPATGSPPMGRIAWSSLLCLFWMVSGKGSPLCRGRHSVSLGGPRGAVTPAPHWKRPTGNLPPLLEHSGEKPADSSPGVSKLFQQGASPLSLRPCGGLDCILKRKEKEFLWPTNNPEMHFK
ncbi:Hypothetical predicted protein [Podarcis lilfordi]|uniref:Uncharacterized protein n=1 Tax=Podarcis lilfordi TaxID=74358 RepID=A0AA35QQ50_9SAUR|nr:Hypothetical predicted protein [Podarcis lilfordi]